MAISAFFIFDQLLVARSRNICYMLSAEVIAVALMLVCCHHFYTFNTPFQIFVCRKYYF